ncbi:MAG: response regulator [Ruminiclostridium sp.]
MKNILIIDDAPFIRMALRTLLENNGYTVVGEAENGKIGVAKFAQLRPDIVTLDITMPEMGGVTALKEIMNIDKTAKVIMVSSMGQEGVVREAIIAGAKSFIVKPFKDDQVLKTLSKL